MKKASKIIFSLILLSICVGGIFLYHNNEEIKRQYNIGVQETQDAFRDFNNLVLSLLEKMCIRDSKGSTSVCPLENNQK